MMKKTLLLLTTILVVALVAGFFIRQDYPTRQTAERVFTIAEDFTKVRKIMVRSNATQEIVTMGGDSQFVSQKWDMPEVDPGDAKLGEGMLIKALSGEGDWRLDLTGQLVVKTKSDYIGEIEIELQQTVEIVPDSINSETALKTPGEKLKDYLMLTRLERDGQQTKVTLRLTQEIKTVAPWFAHSIADRRVQAAAAQTIEKQEQVMRQLIDEKVNERRLFPL